MPRRQSRRTASRAYRQMVEQLDPRPMLATLNGTCNSHALHISTAQGIMPVLIDGPSQTLFSRINIGRKGNHVHFA